VEDIADVDDVGPRKRRRPRPVGHRVGREGSERAEDFGGTSGDFPVPSKKIIIMIVITKCIIKGNHLYKFLNRLYE
jgi:hypothetical protein